MARPSSIDARLAALLPDLRRGVRAAVVTVVPFFLAQQLARPELTWAALGGWLGSLADPGGSARARGPTMAAFLFGGSAAIALGTLAATSTPGAVLALGAVAFAASMAQAAGGVAASVGTTIAIIAAIATAHAAPPLSSAAWFAAGVGWAIVLSSLVWPTWPHLPLRHAVARVHDELAAFAEAIADELGAPGGWAALARERQRPVRRALEAARSVMVALRARRRGETTVGANLRTLFAEAEGRFFRLIAYADELEARGGGEHAADVAALRELAQGDRAIRDQLLTRRPSAWQPRALAAGPLAEELQAGVRAGLARSVDLEAHGEATAADAVVAAHEHEHEGARALRDAWTWRSPVLRHALRVAVAAVAATVVGHELAPRHATWLTVTTIAVLQPHLGTTLDRVVERVIGTALGGVIAVALIAGLHQPIAIALAMFPLAVLAVVTRPRSYRLFVLFLTPVFLLVADRRWHPDLATALVRLADVALGGAIAAAAALVSPTPERTRLPGALAGALDALAGYLDVVADGGERARLVAMRRAVGVALEQAEVSLERMLAEPRHLRTDDAAAVLVLTHGRRLATMLTSRTEPRPGVTPAPLTDDVRAYAKAALAAARGFVLTGERTAVAAPASVEPSLARLVRQVELVAAIARPPAARAIE